jgi:hypothetical protein
VEAFWSLSINFVACPDKIRYSFFQRISSSRAKRKPVEIIPKCKRQLLILSSTTTVDFARQTAWLYRYLETYDLYLVERSRDVAFFSRGGWDKSSEAILQRNNRSKQMRDKLSREVANMKSHGCAASMK